MHVGQVQCISFVEPNSDDAEEMDSKEFEGSGEFWASGRMSPSNREELGS